MSPLRRTRGPRGRPLRLVRTAIAPEQPLALWASLAVVASGFVVLAVTWGGVAGIDVPSRQLPYVVSGGVSGLMLITAGIAGLLVAEARRRSAVRVRQLSTLLDALTAPSDAVDPRFASPEGSEEPWKSDGATRPRAERSARSPSSQSS